MNINIEQLFQAIHIIEANSDSLTETRNSQHKPLDLLILLILNQSCTDIIADKAFLQLKDIYPNYHELLIEQDKQAVENAIRICGLAKSKTTFIFAVLEQLSTDYSLDENMPYIQDMTDSEALQYLTSMRGIGIKSASCLLMFAFQRDIFPIDTHVSRIFTRLGILPPKISSDKAHKLVQAHIPPDTSWNAHVFLIEHGRNICLPRPLCQQCPFSSICCSSGCFI